MIISPSKEFIFIHLEKCGGTSVESALESHLAWHDMIIGSTVFGEGIQNLYFNRFGVDAVKENMLWKHSSAQDIYYYLGPSEWKNFKKFAIVRNPVELIESYYNFSKTVVKYHMGRISRSLWKEKIRLQDFPNAFPFTEKYVLAYIQCVLDDSGINGFTENFLPDISSQTGRLSINSITDMDLIIDLSQLNQKWEHITDLLGFDKKISLPHLNNSEKSGEELSSRAIKKIKKHFALDYQILPKYTGAEW